MDLILAIFVFSLILILILPIGLAVERFFCCLFDCMKKQEIRQKIGIYVGLHKIVKNLYNKINAIQNFFATTTDYESRGQEFEPSRAHHLFL